MVYVILFGRMWVHLTNTKPDAAYFYATVTAIVNWPAWRLATVTGSAVTKWGIWHVNKPSQGLLSLGLLPNLRNFHLICFVLKIQWKIQPGREASREKCQLSNHIIAQISPTVITNTLAVVLSVGATTHSATSHVRNGILQGWEFSRAT